MKKALLILSLILFAPSAALSQIDLGIDTDRPAKKEEKSTSNEEKKDGIFSFMNFSFSSKKKDDALSGENKETFFEKTIRLADEGDLDSQLTLGYLYLYGEDNTPIDYKKSFKYYSMAAEQNDLVALNNMGSLYYNGIGVDKDRKKALEMFQKASNLGNSESSVNLGFIYLTGNGATIDNKQAMVLCYKAAKEGYPTGQFMTGCAYYKGFVVPKDTKKAFEMIKAAANVNFADANYILALMYMEGVGTTKNYGNAVRQFSRAAMQGNVDAMLALGEIYAKGKIYAQNIYQAHIWYNIASLYGAPGAAELRDNLEKGLKIEEVLQAQTEAEKYKEAPSEITIYIRNTFGNDVKSFLN
jgi:TPR repeat protein